MSLKRKILETSLSEPWRGGSGVARSPSHESVTTELSLFSVSSAASDARVLRLLASKAGQGPDPSVRGLSPNPDSKLQNPCGSVVSGAEACGAVLCGADACGAVLCGCAALCAALGLRRSFSAADVSHTEPAHVIRNSSSEMGLCAALEALTTASRSCSTWVTVGGSQLPSPQRSHPIHPGHRPLPIENKKVRQHYIRRRLLSTYRALERMSQSDFNLDRLEAAAVSAVTHLPSSITLTVPSQTQPHARILHAEAQSLALTAADVERERGRPLSKYERNMMIFNWLHTLDDSKPV